MLGELEITDAIQNLLEDEYEIESHVVTSWWKDTGNPEELLIKNRGIVDELECSFEEK